MRITRSHPHEAKQINPSVNQLHPLYQSPPLALLFLSSQCTIHEPHIKPQSIIPAYENKTTSFPKVAFVSRACLLTPDL